MLENLETGTGKNGSIKKRNYVMKKNVKKSTHQKFSLNKYNFCGNNNHDICLHLTNSWQGLTVNLTTLN